MNDDIDLDGEIGFAPAVSATGASTDGVKSSATARRDTSPGKRSRRPALRRRLGASAILLAALASMGSAYAVFATSSGASATSSDSAQAGRQLFQNSCITCHGANLQGVKAQGPPLIGVGSAATYFQVITGRMPVAAQGAYIGRKEAKFSEKQTEQIAAYVESVGGGPSLPAGSLRAKDSQIAMGGQLFRLNCASCHGTTFKGAALSAGKIAPSLNPSSDRVLYAAMLSGPENMPVFSNNELTPSDKKAIISYVQTLKASKDPGGSGIDRIGPVSEAIVIWVAGVGALMVAILWIGARAR